MLFIILQVVVGTFDISLMDIVECRSRNRTVVRAIDKCYGVYDIVSIAAINATDIGRIRGLFHTANQLD